jgi:hypothetical protein
MPAPASGHSAQGLAVVPFRSDQQPVPKCRRPAGRADTWATGCVCSGCSKSPTKLS